MDVAYNLSIKVVLLDHDDVDGPGILESKESETSGSAGSAIAHDSALENFTKLREVVFQGFYDVLGYY